MPDYTCTSCRLPIPPGTAHVRSVNFRTVAWCRVCWVWRVPEQRRPSESSERVEA